MFHVRFPSWVTRVLIDQIDRVKPILSSWHPLRSLIGSELPLLQSELTPGFVPLPLASIPIKQASMRL